MKTTPPILKLVIPFIIGILIFYDLDICFEKVMITLTSIVILYFLIKVSGFSYTMRNSWIFGVYASLLFFVMGGVMVKYSSRNYDIDIRKEGMKIVEGRVSSVPRLKKKSVKIVLTPSVIYRDSLYSDFTSEILCYIKRDSLSEALIKGDIIVFKSYLKVVKDRNNPHEFKYSKYLNRKNIYLQTYISDNAWKLVRKNNSLTLIERFRDFLISRIDSVNTDEKNKSILKALVLGDKTDLDKDTVASFRTAGAMHVLAVSGLHVGIIYAIMTLLFRFMPAKRKYVSAIVIVIVIWMYAFLTGFSPSVQRSALMFTLITLSDNLQRMKNTYNAIAVSAFLILLYDPNILFSIGFQFSYLAVISIVFFQPRIFKLIFVRNKFLKFIWSITTVSLAAQIGVAPLSIFYFHEFPTYFFISNLIVIPLAPLIMQTTILILIMGTIPYVTPIVEAVLNGLMFVFNSGVEFVSGLPHSKIENIFITSTETALIYTIVILIILMIELKIRKIFIVTLLTAIAFLVLVNVRVVTNLTENSMVIYNSQNSVVIDCFVNNSCISFYTGDKMKNRFVSNNNRISHLVDSVKEYNISKDTVINFNDGFVNNNIISLLNKTIVLANDKRFLKLKSKSPLKIDILILSAGVGKRISKLFDIYNPKLVIIPENYYLSKEWINILKKRNIKYYDLMTNGAYKIKSD